MGTEHHDNYPHFHYLPSGARIYTYFVYLSDHGLEGGATFFPRLNITVPAKRGAAVLFPNTLDSAPQRGDGRTTHESLVVTKGEKRGIGMWLYQYNYREFWKKKCTGVPLANKLGGLQRAASEATQTVVFQNYAQTPFYIYDAPYAYREKYLGVLLPDGNFKVDSADGEALHVYSAMKSSGGKLVSKHMVTFSAVQRVNLGKLSWAQWLRNLLSNLGKTSSNEL